MKTKEDKKGNNNRKITVKKIIVLLIFLIIILSSIQFYFYYSNNGKTYGKEERATENIKISKADIINLDEIITQNANENKREEIEKNEIELEYLTKYNTNYDLPKGTIQVIQEGRKGKQEVIIQRTYENEELVSEKQISAKVTKASINKIVEIGGANYTSKYTAKVGDIVYVTATRLSVMTEPSEEAQKIATLSKNDELKILVIQNEWYRISSGNTYGWIKSEGTTYINPNKPKNDETTDNSSKNQKTKSQLISKLSFDMKLNEPSGLTLEQFKKILTDDKDTKNILQDNAEYFYYIEEQYKINGVFVASMAIHESAWGTSKIANDKKNLFGYGAYDSNPYNGAYSFTNYSESIDLVARVLVKYYLNSAGTKIYGGETATGSYYNGSTLTGVNIRYASDKNWANKVYNYMQYLYNKI